MMLVRRPTAARVQAFLAQERSRPFSYAEVGATRGVLPAGYRIDAYGTLLGHGRACFDRAVAAVQRFEHYPARWTHVTTDGGALPREGLTFVAHIEHLGFHSLNSGRVIYVDVEPRRYAFAFGTLPGHEEQGEECFEVTWDEATDAVRYDVRAFSRPRGLLARLGAVVARRYQVRFHRDTCTAMRAAVHR